MSDDLEDLKRRLVIGHKRDGRNVYDETAKAELVTLCLRPGASVSEVTPVGLFCVLPMLPYLISSGMLKLL